MNAIQSMGGYSPKRKPIEIKKENKGKLHDTLGVPKGEKIPVSRLEEAKNSKNSTTRKRANFALVAKTKWNK